MLVCPRCSHQNVVEAAFCVACGAAQPAPYTPGHLTTDILDSPSAIEGERKQVTVLFCDVAGSTSLAERLGAERMHATLDAFFSLAIAHVHRYEGTINQFLGDGFMALFGAPVAQEDHARRAALTALGIHHDVDRQRRDGGGLWPAEFDIRLGLNSGMVVVGRIGDRLRMDYTAIGDTTNLAARMQQLAKPGTTYVTEMTRRLMDPYVETTYVGEKRVKGKQDAVHVYQLLRERRQTQAAPAPAPAIRPRLVGRDEEVAVLAAAVNRLQSGQGGVVSVIGEAGVGKSRLLAETIVRCPPGVQWLEGRTLPFGANFSYSPFRDILRSAAGIADDDSDADAARRLEGLVRRLFPEDAGEILPYIATLLSLPIAAEFEHRIKYLDGHATGLQVFRSVLLLLERLAHERPLALVFEDVHWADRSSLTLLDHILPLVTSVPLLLVVAGRAERDTPAARFRANARDRAGDRYVEIALAPLSLEASRELLDDLIGGESSSGRLKETLSTRAEGNPFFLEEMVRSVVADDVLRWNAAERRWRAAREIEHVDLPATLHDVIAARIDRLDNDAKQLLKIASVIGRRFDASLLRAVSGSDAVDSSMERLLASELIQRRQRTSIEYSFTHALVQETTYATLLSGRRRELHERVGDSIEQLFAERLEDFYDVLAYHYARAEAWQKAQRYLFKAGDEAGRIAADTEALAHYREAIDAYEKAFGDRWEPVQRSTLERKIGEALFRQGSHEQALSYVISAKARLSPRLTALPRSAWGIRLAIGAEILRRTGRATLASAGMTRKPTAVDPHVLDEIARAGEVTGWIDYFLNPERFFLQALTGLSYFESHPHAIGLIYNHMSIGMICDVLPLSRIADHHHHRALAIAKESAQPIALGHAHLGMGIHAHCFGQLHAALAEYETSAAVFREIGHIRGWGGATMMCAWIHNESGAFGRALARAQAVSTVGEESSDPQVRAWGLQRGGVSKRFMGRTDEAMRDLEVSIELSRRIPDYSGVVQGHAFLALCHLDQGDPVTARRLSEEADRIRRERKLRGIWVASAITSAAEVALAELEHDHRSRSLRRNATRACDEAWRQGRTAGHRRATALRLLGELRWCQNKPTAADRCWQRAMTEAKQAGARYELGLIKARIGRRFDRRDELEQAAMLFDEAGADLNRRQVMALLGRRRVTSDSE